MIKQIWSLLGLILKLVKLMIIWTSKQIPWIQQQMHEILILRLILVQKSDFIQNKKLLMNIRAQKLN